MSSFTSSRQYRHPPGTSPFFSSSSSTKKRTTASPTTTNGGKTDAVGGGAGGGGGGGSVSIMFFFVLMALPASFVLFLCARYACERAHARRERRERRERARAALRTRFGVASSSDGNNNNNTNGGGGGSNGLPASANGGVVVRASTIDRLADAVIAEANHHSGYTRRSSSRRRRRAEERSIASYRAEAVRRDLRRAFRTGDFSGYDVSLLRRVLLQDRIQENGGIESEYDEETTNFRIAAENDAFFVAEEPGPASLKTLESLPRCKINDRKWQRFVAGRARDEIENLQTCALCLEDFPQQNHALIVLECEHVFCESCVVQWFRLRASCPTCRRVVFAYSKKDRESVFSLPKPPPVVVLVEKTEEQEQEEQQQHQEEEEEEEEEDVEKAAAHSPA